MTLLEAITNVRERSTKTVNLRQAQKDLSAAMDQLRHDLSLVLTEELRNCLTCKARSCGGLLKNFAETNLN